jgi:hypothetical protein
MCTASIDFSPDPSFSMIADDGETALRTLVYRVLTNVNPFDLVP